MLKKIAVLLGVLAVCLSGPVQAVTIVWVSEWMSNTAGVPYDQGWIDLLRAQGYKVEADTASNYATLGAAQIAILEAADLVIISRTTNSGGYATDAAEVTQWNSITTPLISMSGFFPRNNRWQWINGASANELADETMMEVVKSDHPVFAGISIDANQVDVIDAAVNSGQGTFITATDVGNGTLIARRADDGSIWIAEWAPGVPFYKETTEKPAGKRMLLTGGGGGAQTAGSMNFTPDGQKIFLNAVAYIAGVSLDPGVAVVQNPAEDQTDVVQRAVLSWTPGRWAAVHDVYFGTDFADVNTASRTDPKGVLVSQGQKTTTFDPPGLLDFGQTYYWRIDEVNAPPTDSKVFKGGVWGFTVEPYAYPVRPISATAFSSFGTSTPVKTIDGSGLNANDEHSATLSQTWLSAKNKQPIWIQFEFDAVYKLHQMWVWNSNQGVELTSGYGAREVAIAYSTDGTTWTDLNNVPEFAQATGKADYSHNTTVDFGGVLARYVKLTVNKNWGAASKQAGLSEVRFFQVPQYARDPQPVTGATDVALDEVLTWRPGRDAARHEVYLGPDADTVAQGTAPVSSVTEPSYGLASAGLEYDRTYYWKVNEVNEVAVPASLAGSVWSFSTLQYDSVDDFESYDDCMRIYYAWVDGGGHNGSAECGVASKAGNGTGSTVGNPQAPYAEQTIVHSGNQSMPFAYNATSEVVRTFDTARDWTLGGAKTLVLFFLGNVTNEAGELYVKINDAKVTYKGASNALSMGLWKQWNIDLAAVAGADLKAVKTLTIGVSGTGKGILYIDDVLLYRAAPAVPVPGDPGTAGLAAHYPLDGDAKDASGHGNTGTLIGEPVFVESKAGFNRALLFDGVNDHAELPIGTVISTLSNATFAAWTNFDSSGSGSWQRIFDFGTGESNYMFLCPRMGTIGAMRFSIRITTSTAESLVTAPVTLPMGWHHVAVVIDGTARTLQLYLDGEVVASGPTGVLPKDLGVTTQNWLGRSQFTADGYYQGMVDEFRIYDRVLPVEEVRYLAGDR